MILGSGRVLLVGPLPPPIGGDTVLTANLLSSRCWRRAGLKIEALDTSAGGRIRVAGERRPPSDMARAWRILSGLRARVRRCDSVLLWMNSTFVCTLGIPVMSLVRLHKKPYLVKPFGTLLPELISALGPARRKAVVSLLRDSYRVLPETALLENELVSATGLGEERFTLLPNYIPDRYLKASRGRGGFSGRAVFAGQVKRDKGVFEIIEAMESLPEMSCDFYGQIHGGDRELYLERIAGSSNCRYAGMTEPGRIMETIGEYDVLLLPTRHRGEGYPAVVLEAFAAGLPVIATAWKSLPELVEDGKTGILLPEGTPGEISAALNRLAADPGLYGRISERVPRRAEEFSEKRVVGDLLMRLVSGSIEGSRG